MIYTTRVVESIVFEKGSDGQRPVVQVTLERCM